MLWTILVYALVGVIAGWLAGMIVKSESGSLWVNMVIGIVGSFIGAFIMKLIGQDGFTGFNLYSILVATFGAIILLVIYKAVRK